MKDMVDNIADQRRFEDAAILRELLAEVDSMALWDILEVKETIEMSIAIPTPLSRITNEKAHIDN